MGSSTDGTDPNSNATQGNNMLAVNDTIDELKKDVLFRPPEVDKCVQDITNDPAYYACGSLLGQW
jgi:hypothetical protein